MRSIIKYIDEALFSSASEFSKADDIDEEFVDLGLSVKWAKCNLGAEKETDFGHYYMWGSTKPNDNDVCCWKNAPFNNRCESYDYHYFNSIKDKVSHNYVLNSDYDPCSYEYGGKDYRMPTKQEFEELVHDTYNEWTTINGRKGYKFTSKKDNTKYIFIPAAGKRNGNSIVTRRVCGTLATSSIDKFDEQYLIWALVFDETPYICVGHESRYNGCSVRCVQDK